MAGRIPPAAGANLLATDGYLSNRDATLWIGGLAEEVTEELLWEMCVQLGVVRKVYIPRDRVNGKQNYAFVEYASKDDRDFALRVLKDSPPIPLFGRPISVNEARLDDGGGGGEQKHAWKARLYVGNLDPSTDCSTLGDVFGLCGIVISCWVAPSEEGSDRTHGFVTYSSFEDADRAIERLAGQFICNRNISVSYAYKSDGSGEKHGTPHEREMALADPMTENELQRAYRTMTGTIADPPYYPGTAPVAWTGAAQPVAWTGTAPVAWTPPPMMTWAQPPPPPRAAPPPPPLMKL